MIFSLTDQDKADFLCNDWQKRPRLFRGLFSPWIDYLSPDELAGLACEESLPSRLVLEKGGDYPWQVRQGPFFEEDLEALGSEGWSLLVRHVNVVVPPIADMLDCFSFLPSWRREDIMVSFAPAGGSVGAHIDNYDVFLVQGMGRRRWEIGEKPMADELLADVQDIRLLKDFVPDHVFELEPGDALYLPPRVAHHGIALDNCMTYSVGFRSPSMSELLRHYADYLEECDASGSTLTERYKDPLLNSTACRAGIDSSEAEQLSQFFFSRIPSETALVAAFAQSMSQPLIDQEFENGELSKDEFIGRLSDGSELRRHENVRAVVFGEVDGLPQLFINGKSYVINDAALLQCLTGPHRVDSDHLVTLSVSPNAADRLFEWYRLGWLYFLDEFTSLG